MFALGSACKGFGRARIISHKNVGAWMEPGDLTGDNTRKGFDAVGLAQHYQGVLGVHILAAVTFVAGVFLLTAMLPPLSGGQGPAPEQQAVLRRLRQWNRFVTTPAMVVVWAFGLTLATAGDWFVATWLQVKMALVIVLSAIHGMQSAKLRRLGIEGRTPRRPTLWPALVIVLLVAGILAMVTVKPWTTPDFRVSRPVESLPIHSDAGHARRICPTCKRSDPTSGTPVPAEDWLGRRP